MRYPDHTFKDEVKLYTSPTLTYDGKRTDGTATTVKARVTEKYGLLKDADEGKETQYDFIVHISRKYTSVAIDQRVDIVYTDLETTVKTEIKSMSKVKDTRGNLRFIKLILRKIRR